MVERREARITSHMRIGYPVFEDEFAADHAQEMNAFYTAMSEALTAYAEEIAGNREGGIRILTADYKTKTEGKRITVEYKLSVRRRGKTEAVKTVSHTWESGVLVPPLKQKSPFSKSYHKMMRLLTRRRK